MKHHRIHIAGGPGSGKSYAADKLAKRLKLPHHELDKVAFPPDDTEYLHPYSKDERKKRLAKLVKNERWIIDGAYKGWLQACYERADMIIVIIPPFWKRQWRVIKRYVQGKFGGDRKTDTLRSTWQLLGYSSEYEHELPELKMILEPYKKKTHYFSSADEAIDFIIQKRA